MSDDNLPEYHELAEALYKVITGLLGRPAKSVVQPNGHITYIMESGDDPFAVLSTDHDIAHADALRLLGRLGMVEITEDDGINCVVARNGVLTSDGQ